jgi:hypothetical protein
VSPRRRQKDGRHWHWKEACQGQEGEALTEFWDEHLYPEALSLPQKGQRLAHTFLNEGLCWHGPKEGGTHFGGQWFRPGRRTITGFRGLGDVEAHGDVISSCLLPTTQSQGLTRPPPPPLGQNSAEA